LHPKSPTSPKKGWDSRSHQGKANPSRAAKNNSNCEQHKQEQWGRAFRICHWLVGDIYLKIYKKYILLDLKN
tara:strand:+ start:328 stop:543 length:216 start_codon:yes stop_codon:yes gene_type:complete